MFDETPDHAWASRYGSEAPLLPDLGSLLNHRSVRAYTSDPIDDATMAGLIAAAQSAATSSNLQLWTAISVDDPDRRDRMAQLCGDQKQVRSAARFLAFCADTHRLEEASKVVGEDAAGLDYTEFFIMAVIDAALAAERLVCAAESLGIGICYIGALRNDPDGVAELLSLPNGVFGAFGLCLGWPAEPMTAEIKPRLRQDAVWHRETYAKDVSNAVADYDRRMKAFYEAQAMKGEVTWSMRSARRVDGSERSLTGRGVLKAWLESRGFNRR